MLSSRHNREFARSLANGHYERTDTGLYFPRQKVNIGGIFYNDVRRNGELIGEEASPNLVVDEGLDHLLNVLFRGGTQVTTWYIGIFEGNYTPQASDTASNIATNSTESTAYDESVRQEFDEAAPSSQTVTNSASRATFTINATKTIYGAFLISDSTKSGTTGTLLSASAFSSSRDLVDDDELLIRYDFTAADA